MRPILFTLFDVPFPSWGVFFAVGFLASFGWGYFEAKRLGIDPNKALDVGFWIVVGAIIGSRLLYVIVDWDVFRKAPLEILRIWNGGMVLYGGVFGVIIAAYIAVKVMRLPVAKSADLITISACFGLIFGRFGCLLNGCCYGRPTDLPWHITYANPSCVAGKFKGIYLHPTPIYSTLMLILVFIIIFILSRRKRFDSQVFGSFIFFTLWEGLSWNFFEETPAAGFVSLYFLLFSLPCYIIRLSATSFAAFFFINRF